METASNIIACLLLNLALFLPCLTAAVSYSPSFQTSMSRGTINHEYTRYADVERHCHSVLASAAYLRADANRAGVGVHHLSFTDGDWSQDAGQAPLLPFHGTYADAGPELLEAVHLASFMLTDMDTVPRRGPRTAFNISGILSFTITRNWPGISKLHVLLQGVYTETHSSGGDEDSGGERVLCMVGDAVLPVRGSNGTDPWDWAKKHHGGYSNFEPPVVTDGNILLVLRYPRMHTLTTRAVHGEMTSTNSKSDGAYFDTVRFVSHLAGGYDSGYQFQPEDAVQDAVAGCSNDPVFHDDGDAMGHLMNSKASLCDTISQSIFNNQLMEVIPNWGCKGTDAFCSRAGPFDTTSRAMQDMAFTRSAIAVQGLQCKPTASIDGTATARAAAVFRYVPPWEHQPTAARRTGLSGMTLSAEGVWNASMGKICMVGCLGVGKEACHHRVTLSIRTTFSVTRRGYIVGKMTAMDGSHAPLFFQQRVNPSRFGRYGPSASYIYTKVEQAREHLRQSEPTGFRDGFVGKSLFIYPNIAGDDDSDMVSLSNLADNLNFRFCVVKKPPFVPEWMEETMFELKILSIGTLVGSYSPQFQGGFSKWIELLRRVRVRTMKQQVLNVSAELTASRNFFSSVPVMSLEGVYNPQDGRMYLIGCRNVDAPWRVLSKRTDLEDGTDCSIEVTVEYPSTATRWLMIRQTAKVSIASTREEDDLLHFTRSELRTLPIVYRDQLIDELVMPIVQGLLCITLLSVAKVILVPVAFFQ
ncbi:hypothetical protein HU200_050601 [Digitaria exilis]|uniref:DUF2921 domain-containing protein n=1 Tax=Digitaria exilis TaxID=1010633 RepID=A0A835B2H8_9POAL|nr:hypothetical protein HU200_050601 [Digitaria exilis]